MTFSNEWLFELANSNNLSKIGELTTIKSRSLSLTLDRAGEFTFNIHLEDDIADQILEVETCVLVKKKISDVFQIVWSGPVWGINMSTPNTLGVKCVGWLQTLEKRFLEADVTFTSIDAGAIVTSILNTMNTLSSGYPTYITPGDVTPTILRTRNFKKYENILSILQGLSDLESGIDYLVDPATRELDISGHMGGTSSNLLFEYGNNISSVSRDSDVSRLCNRMFVSGGPGTTTQIGNDFISQARYGIFSEFVSLSDVKNNTILQAYATAELAVRSFPLRIYSFSTLPAGVGTISPRIFDDFVIGDVGYLTVHKGPLEVVKQAVRVFSLSLTFDDNGNEQSIFIQTTAQ